MREVDPSAQNGKLPSCNGREELVDAQALKKPARIFACLDKPLFKVFDRLHVRSMLQPLALKSTPDPLPPNYKVKLYCCYHQSTGHGTKNCS